MKTREQLLQLLYQGANPIVDFKNSEDPTEIEDMIDLIGWNSNHPILANSVDLLKPRIIFETGVWYGGSANTLASSAKRYWPDAQVIACDTFLACDILRTVTEWVPKLHMEFGRPTYWKNFYANVLHAGNENNILPLHTDARSGLRLLKRLGIKVDLIHHDASHYAPDVYEDLQLCWDVLIPGGHIIVDDYMPSNKTWPDHMDFNGVVAGVEQIVLEKNASLQVSGVKARIVKPL